MIVQVITVRLVQTQNHGNLTPADGAPARLLFQLGDARRTESLMPTRHKRKSCIDETHFTHILRRRRNLVLFLVDSCIPARQRTDICNTRCSILSRFSHFHVLHFPPLQSGAAFSCPAISCLAFSASPFIVSFNEDNAVQMALSCLLSYPDSFRQSPTSSQAVSVTFSLLQT